VKQTGGGGETQSKNILKDPNQVSCEHVGAHKTTERVFERRSKNQTLRSFVKGRRGSQGVPRRNSEIRESVTTLFGQKKFVSSFKGERLTSSLKKVVTKMLEFVNQKIYLNDMENLK